MQPNTANERAQIVRVGLIGHRVISDANSIARLREEARALFAIWRQQYAMIEAHSQLAIGADTILTEVALEFSATVVNVIPFLRFEDDFTPKELPAYRHLRDLAVRIQLQPFTDRSDEAYLQAGMLVVDGTDVLVAAWDGEQSRGKGGTADIIEYAHAQKKIVKILQTAR